METKIIDFLKLHAISLQNDLTSRYVRNDRNSNSNSRDNSSFSNSGERNNGRDNGHCDQNDSDQNGTNGYLLNGLTSNDLSNRFLPIMPRISRSRVSAKQKELWIRKIKSPNHNFIEIFDHRGQRSNIGQVMIEIIFRVFHLDLALMLFHSGHVIKSRLPIYSGTDLATTTPTRFWPITWSNCRRPGRFGPSWWCWIKSPDTFFILFK